MNALSITLTIAYLLFAISPVMAQTVHPENWAPTWINPSWERPANMIPDTSISIPGDLNVTQLDQPAACGGCNAEIFSQW